MLVPLQQNQKIDGIELTPDDSIFSRPDVHLITPKQWRYIQRRCHISPRELQVAMLICRGFTNEEIAKTLRIKPATVKTHIRNVYRRIHVRTKIQMLLKFVEQLYISENNTRPAGSSAVARPRKAHKRHLVLPDLA